MIAANTSPVEILVIVPGSAGSNGMEMIDPEVFWAASVAFMDQAISASTIKIAS
jgi:hypothetical protein